MIQADHLTKVYKIPQKDPGVAGAVKALFRPHFQSKPAVTDVSFTIEPGEIVGYIGVNGAGKSTTIKMLTGILVPTAGQVRVFGRDPHRDRVANARDIGVVFGQRTQLWWDLALIESLTMVGRIYEVPDARFKQLMDEFAETLALKELLKIPIRNMSLGQKMRAELAATLIHEPRIVYLDEPTIGLDLLVKERIRAFIKQVNREKGTTVILTTHDLGDIEELCKRVLIIDNGSDDAETLAYLAQLASKPGYRVLRDDGPFNYSALNNGAARQARGELICLLNNDIEAINPDWLSEIVCGLDGSRTVRELASGLAPGRVRFGAQKVERRMFVQPVERSSSIAMARRSRSRACATSF